MSGSLLETFYMLFESNADKVEDGNKEAEKSADSLEKKLTKNDKVATDGAKSFLDFVVKAKAAVASIALVGASAALALDAATNSEKLRKISLATNEDTQSLDAWGQAISRVGGDAEAFQSTVTSLSNSIRETAFTGDGALTPALLRLGVNLRKTSGDIKTPLELLPELADKLAALDSSQAFYLGDKLGLDKDTIILLRQGRQAVQDLVDTQRKHSAFSAQNVATAKEFNQQMWATKAVFGQLSQEVGTMLLPPLTWLLQKVRAIGEFARENSGLMEGLFIGAASAITAYYVPAMLSAAAATLAATWPILAIAAAVGAAIAAFALVYDDVKAFANGQNSLLGEAAKKWPIVAFAIESVTRSIRFLGSVANEVLGFFNDLLSSSGDSIDGLFSRWADGVQGFISSIPIVGGALSKFGDALEPYIASIKDFFNFLLKALSLGVKFLINPVLAMEKLDAEVSQNLAKGQAVVAAADSSPLNSVSGQAINNMGDSDNRRSMSLNVGNVTVHTAAQDAGGMAKAAGDALKDQFSQVLYDFDDGVSA